MRENSCQKQRKMLEAQTNLQKTATLAVLPIPLSLMYCRKDDDQKWTLKEQ